VDGGVDVVHQSSGDSTATAGVPVHNQTNLAAPPTATTAAAGESADQAYLAVLDQHPISYGTAAHAEQAGRSVCRYGAFPP
jgi:uncharacterized protein DUF732